ncbi:unnamed protein product [Amaranthus hypochondriacus]
MGLFTVSGFLMLSFKPVDPSTEDVFSLSSSKNFSDSNIISISVNNPENISSSSLFSSPFITEKSSVDIKTMSCATVEEMGEDFKPGFAAWKESLRVRSLIHHHFLVNGPSRVRGLSPDQFCRHNYVLAKASEAGFGNEMYKLLTAAALSVMLNRSLIIGQTRGKYPFGDYITYSTNASFSLQEVKHLWKKHNCVSRYGRHLVVRIDDFQNPARTNILCSNWRKWQQPIIWLQNTTDAVAAQFFLKNVHPKMRSVAYELFGKPELISRPNVFGELMRVLISPSPSVEAAVKSVLADGNEPDITLHMRMMMNRPLSSVPAALRCIRKAMENVEQVARPKVVLVSDTPSYISLVKASVEELAEVIHFDYKHIRRNISLEFTRLHTLKSRAKDWGPAPRWVAFVDFFLASRAKYAVISGANRRVGTTYAQLIAALAAANNLDENSNTYPSFVFLSSFQRNLLKRGLRNQIGWGHAWNRFAGPLSCQRQAQQCAYTPLLPPGWWDGIWQSPITRDIRRLRMYGVKLSGLGTIDEEHLQSYCKLKKSIVFTSPISLL